MNRGSLPATGTWNSHMQSLTPSRLLLPDKLLPDKRVVSKFTLLRCLVIPFGKWVVCLAWLKAVCFVLVMLPAFIPCYLHYLFSKLVLKGVRYGPSYRHRLDVYQPVIDNQGRKRPVIIFFSGGAWFFGYRCSLPHGPTCHGRQVYHDRRRLDQ